MRVLVVDDSIFMRKILSDMINSDPALTVVGTAINGKEALDKIIETKPQVITLDINMPVMDGLTTLKHIMKDTPLPVIMVSSATREGAEETFQALDYGAFDYVAKPAGKNQLNLNVIKENLLIKIKSAKNAKIIKKTVQKPKNTFSNISFNEKIITIGASTGGPPAIERVLNELPKNIPPIIIVQHMPAAFTALFAQRLDKMTKLHVKEGVEKDRLETGSVIIAPGGSHLQLDALRRIKLTDGVPINRFKPSVDPMMHSVSRYFKEKAIGVIMTGMGRDGTDGITQIHRKGGWTIAQNEATSVVYGMPKAAVETGNVKVVAPLSKISSEIVNACRV